MRDFDYLGRYPQLLTPAIVSYLSHIHEGKGQQQLLIETHADILTDFRETARIQSIEASNRMEEIYMVKSRWANSSVRSWALT